MRNSLDRSLSILAEKTYDNTKSISKGNRQRRDEFVDLYGIEFYRSGTPDDPAVFHVSVSGDESFMHRFQFKIVIEPFQMLVGSKTGSTSLEFYAPVVNQVLQLDDPITPNPHSHSLSAGITTVPVTASDFHVICEGMDITAYLKAQCTANGWNWFNGEGVYPSTDLEQSFDLMEVASDLRLEGREDDADKLLRQGWKPITLKCDSQPFSATLVLYLKYQNMGR